MTTFKFTRSDGNVAHWPDSANKPILAYKQILNQYDPISRDDKRYQHWLRKIGTYIAEKQGLPGGDHWIADFPAGFRLYVHLTQKAGAALRKDVFLFGRENVRFRSPAEFQPHAWWLIRPDFDAPCVCSWCAGPGAGRTYLVETDEGLRPARDSQPDTYVYSAFPRTIRERLFNSNNSNQPVRLPAIDLDYVAPLRSKELHETRRYRNGEIVWVPVKPIKRTSNSRGSLTAATTVEEHKASLKMLKIDYWPGLIKEPRLISRPVKKETMGRVITQTWDYVCSCIAIDHEIQVSEAELLPFLAYTPKEGNYEDVLQALARLDRLPEFEGPNRQTFAEVSQSWESAVLSYAVALSTVDVAVECCICTNEFFTPLELNILGYKGEDYQGLWWGAERLWMGDLCRLQSTRETLNLDLLPPFNPSIEPGGLFLQITLISKTPSTLSAPPSGIVAGRLFDLVDEGQVAEGSSSLSVPNNDKGQDKTTSPWPPSWEPISSQQCSASADHLASSFSPTLSLASSASAQQQHSNEPKTYFEALAITSTDVWPLPEPPRGKVFRQIHPTSTQLVVALDQIAGRYYPGLSREGAAASIWRDEQFKETLASLEGRSEGWVARLECMRWKKDRWEQIFDSLREVVEERVEALFRELKAVSEPAGSTARRRMAAEVETTDSEFNVGSKKRRTADKRQNEGQGEGGPQSLRAG